MAQYVQEVTMNKLVLLLMVLPGMGWAGESPPQLEKITVTCAGESFSCQYDPLAPAGHPQACWSHQAKRLVVQGDRPAATAYARWVKKANPRLEGATTCYVETPTS